MREAAWIADRLEVHENDPGVRVVGPVAQQVVAADVDLVAERDEVGDAQLPSGCFIGDDDADPARLRGDSERAGGWDSPHERGIQPDGCRDDAKAVRPHDPHPVSTCCRHEGAFAFDPIRVLFGEPGRHHDGGANAKEPAVGDHLDDARRRDGDHGQVRHGGELAHVRHRFDPADPQCGWMHDAHPTAERTDEVLQDRPTGRGRPTGTDDDDVARCQDRHERGHGRGPVPSVRALLQQRLSGQVELDVRLAPVVPGAHHQSNRTEHEQHGLVAGQRFRDQLRDPRPLGDQRQILQKERADSLVLVGVGHGKGDLGFRSIRDADVFADRDHSVGIESDEHNAATDLLTARRVKPLVE